MQILFDDGLEPRELDLRVNDPGATVADLATALDPTATRPGRLLIGDHVAAAELELGESGLHEGAVVRFAEPRPADDGPTQSRLVLEVVGGLDAGRRYPLAAGTTVVGRDAGCDLVLRSSSVSRRHAEIRLDDDGRLRVRDLGSLNGTRIDGRPVAGEVVVGDGQVAQFGALQAVARPPKTDDRPMAVDPLRHAGAAGTMPFNRPPRPAQAPPPAAVTAPEAPRERANRTAFNVVAFLAPLLLAGALIATTGQVGFLVVTLLSPIMVLGTWIQGRVQGRRTSRREAERFSRALERFRADLHEQVAAERARLEEALPDVAEVVRRALLPSTHLWERRPHHDDVLRLRAGIGDVPWTPQVEELRKDAPDEVAEAVRHAGVLPGAPVAVDLSAGGVVGIVGDRSAAAALARSLVCQAAVHHGPADLPMVVLAGTDTAPDWDWTKWLPHARDAAGGGQRRLSAERELATAMADAWLQEARGRERQRGAPGATKDRPQPTLLVVVDDESLTEGRRAPVRSLLRGEGGPVAGIVLASTRDRLPAVCTTVIELRGPDGEAALDVPHLGGRIDRFLVAGVGDDTARECARALVRFEDPELAVAGAGLPDVVRLLPLLGVGDADPDAVQAQWAAAGAVPAPRAPLGVAEDGVFHVDLHADGPHALIGGTTGSGKSELLRSLVAGLAARVDPDHLTFVLIDFKGGSAFDECARLPHTVGMVTDLDEHLAERALRCLEAELKHRERVLRAAGVSDLPSYLRRGDTGEPLPRLVVVVDEFATLKAELPDFIDALVGIAQRGRSLGVHLVLATQRPSGAVSDNIRANTNLRVALRVQDEADSTDIIDRPDAGRLPRHAAGRAYVRLGAGEVVAIQTALVTAARHERSVAPVDVAPFVFGPSPRPPAPPPASAGAGDDGDAPRVTDLSRLVEAIREAHRRSGRPAPRRPWPDPLPAVVDLDALLDTAPDDGDEVLIALADDPDRQRQYPVGWRPADGNLVVYGVGGSGTTTTLGTLALSLAHTFPPDRLHLYVVDVGAGALAGLDALPHVGAVLAASERERQVRLVRHLRGELDRRRQLTAEARRDEPMVVVLIDGFPALNAEYRDVEGMAVIDELQRVFADGPDVGLHLVLSADRPGGVPSTWASLVRQKLVLRLADPYDYGQFGASAKEVPAFPPGGGLLAETKRVVQVAMPADGLADAAGRIAARHAPARRPPPPIRRLPGEVTTEQLGVAAVLDRRPWRIPVGVRERDLGPGELVVYEGEHVLVAGPSRSGKTTALAMLAARCRAARADLVVLTVAPGRSPLRELVDADAHLPPERARELPGLLAERAPVLVLVDDADAIEDEDGEPEGLLSTEHPGLLVVAAGRAETLRSTFSHWTKAVRRSKLGVLLQPNNDLDGALLGATLPRRTPVAMTVGRGFLVNGGDLDIVQLARPARPARAHDRAAPAVPTG